METPGPYEHENIRLYFEQEMFLDRQRYPENPEQSQAIVDEIVSLAAGGKHIALVDGAFDVPQPNHQWYLHHCRLLAGRNYYTLRGEADTKSRQAAACEEVVLVVTLDTDERVAEIKGNKAEKGGVRKPVYPWPLRAQYISNFMTPTLQGLYRPVVDIVTIDGSQQEYGTPHESHLAFGAALLEKGALHTWIFYGEHDAKKYEAEKLVTIAGAKDCQVTGIQDHMNYCVDEYGQSWQSSTIIKRILGSNVSGT